MKNTASPQRWLIVAFFTVFMVIMTFNLILYPANALQTIEIYGIDQAGITTLSSVTSVVGLVAGFIFGPMIDKLGSRKVVTASMLIGVALFFVRAFILTYMAGIILTFLASFFIGVCQVAAPKVLDTWFTKENVGTAVAVQSAGAGLGSAIVFSVAAIVGLQGCMLIVAGLYAALFVVWLIIGKDGPVKVDAAPAAPADAMGKVYKSRYIWLLAIAYSCCVGGTMLINTYCINAFLGKGLDPAMAATMGTVINLGLFIGGYLCTFVMSVVKRYNLMLAICVIGGAIGYLGAWFLPLGPQTWVLMILGCLIMGGGIMMCVGRVPLIPLTGEYPRECIGTASGALETIKGVITFVLPIAIATVFGLNFNAIFICFGVMCLVALVTGCLLVPEVGPKGKLQQDAAANAARDDEPA